MTDQTAENPAPSTPDGHHAGHGSQTLLALCLGALGVVFGDIGTSPLYCLKECFGGHAKLPLTEANIVGVLSLVIWSLIGLVSILYVLIVLNADNDGEGGELALLALAMRGREAKGVAMNGGLVVLGLFGASLLYGDGVITPAISVLSAIEGLEVATTFFSPLVVPITVAILVGLFAVQSRGTAQIGKMFGPVCLLWFSALAILGLAELVKHPQILRAFDPTRGIWFLTHNGWHGFVAMGSVFLAVTGGEALYADMGHFGKRPIRIVWYGFVLPSLMLNYLGQGALLLSDPTAVSNPFYKLVPSWGLYPMVMLAAAATVIASQAVISGVFSMTRQAIQLGYLPRLEVRHTSAAEIGQIYLPQINWAMLIATVILVLEFRTSSNLAAAYGIAVAGTMVITVMMLYFVMRDLWDWSVPAAAAVCGTFLAVDLTFLGANLLKFMDGGWFPVLVGVALYLMMVTWKKGREVLRVRLAERIDPLDRFFAEIEKTKPARVPGAAIYLAASPSGTPMALNLNVDHNKVLHEVNVLVTIISLKHPYARGETLTVETIRPGFHRAIVKVGFMEKPDVPAVVAKLRKRGLPIPEGDVTYFVGRESLVPTERPGMRIFQEHIFAVMARNSETVAAYFGIPASKLVEMGVQIDL